MSFLLSLWHLRRSKISELPHSGTPECFGITPARRHSAFISRLLGPISQPLPLPCPVSFFFFFLSRYRPRTRGLYQPAKHGGFHLFLMEQWMDKKNSGGIRDMEERKERRNKSKAYSNGLLSHYSGTGLSRPADQPPKESPHPLYKTLFIQPTLSYFSSGTKATKSLRFPSCPHPICVSRLS